MYRVIKQSQVAYGSEDMYYIEEGCRISSETALLSIRQREIELDERIKQKEEQIAVERQRILDEARQKANQILAEAEGEGKRIFEAKKQEGFQEGLALAEEKIAEFVCETENLKEDLSAEFEKKVRYFEEQILDLALVLSRKIIDIELDKNDEAILAAVKGLINRFRDENNLIIELSEENAEKLKSVQMKKKLVIKENNELDNQGVLLNSEHGIIDASIDVQFENLKSSLLKE
ncbi:MAG: FliH/SctL family protein [Clostridia bacterium]|nr:FliH/SctL family protein [Clostridia bacterium]